MTKPAERIITPMLSPIEDIGGNIFAMVAPKNHPAPYLIFQGIDTDFDRHLKGPSGIVQKLVQIDTYANEYWKCKSIAGEVREIMDGFIGTVDFEEDAQQHSIDVKGITCQSDIDLLDKTDNPVLYRVTARYLISIKE